MYKGTHFNGQPMYGQLINLLDKEEILKFSRKHHGERYVKHFDAYQHLTVMLYAVIKVHTNIHANEGVPSDIRFTSAATNDSFMLKPTNYSDGDIIAMDRAYIDYSKFENLTNRGIVYVTKMKKNLVYEVLSDTMYMAPEGLMEHRVQIVEFKKLVKDGEDVRHKARIITYADLKKKKPKLISLLTNDMEMGVEEIIAIYRKRWEIELLFKQLKQNFPLRYFYGESSNAIKIQIWGTLIANLLLMVIQKRIKRPWSFSGLATMIRIMLITSVHLNTLTLGFAY